VSATVLCAGCGLQVAVPPDHSGRRLRCPECGVMSDVPDTIRARATVNAPSSSKAIEEEIFTGPDPGPTPLPASAPPNAITAEAPSPAAPAQRPVRPAVAKPKKVFACSTCGEMVRAPLGKRRKAWRCPICASPAPEETAIRAAAVADVRLSPPRVADAPASPVEPEMGHTSHDHGDHLPYPIDRSPLRKCGNCGKLLPVETVLCISCGFHEGAGQKMERPYEPIRRHWEAGLPLRKRFLVFLALQVFGLAIYAWQALDGEHWLIFLVPWLFYTLLLAFVLGTFDRFEISRNEEGKAQVKRGWRICFLPRRAYRIPWHQYDGVVTYRTRESGCLAWFVILSLIPLGILPAVLWWWFFVHRDAHFLALSRGHGCPELTLYRGISEEKVLQIAQVLHQATGLPWRKD